jgi:uncharacterized protein YabE (DUF348 family)
MRRKQITWAAVCLLAAGLVAGAVLVFHRTVTIEINGQTTRTTAWVFTVGSVLHSSGITLNPADHVSPSLNTWVTLKPTIYIERAVPVIIFADGETTQLASSERNPVKLLEQAGIRFSMDDLLLLDGQLVQLENNLPLKSSITLQVQRPTTLTINEDDNVSTLSTHATTIGQALWEAGIFLESEDSLSPGIGTEIDRPLTVLLHRADTISIIYPDKVVKTRTSAATVGEALVQAGLGLQGLDYSIPAADKPLPLDGKIRVVSVQEEILLEEKSIPFESRTEADPNTELDQHSVIQPGQEGIIVSRTRVRYEDGKEVGRQQEGEWQARAVENRILGYGTKVVIKTAVVDGVTIDYWRAITVFATSYSPCNSDASRCYPNTATGLPVKKGVAGVKKAWFGYLVGQNVYVPGYGVAQIADFGAGYPDGRAHIDLGYSDADYIAWHSWVTIYFLTPVPDTILWIMQ